MRRRDVFDGQRVDEIASRLHRLARGRDGDDEVGGRSDAREEAVAVAPAERGLKRRHGREVRREGVAHDVSAALLIDADAHALIGIDAAQKGRIDNVARGIEFEHEGVVPAAAAAWLHGVHEGKVR